MKANASSQLHPGLAPPAPNCLPLGRGAAPKWVGRRKPGGREGERGPDSRFPRALTQPESQSVHSCPPGGSPAQTLRSAKRREGSACGPPCSLAPRPRCARGRRSWWRCRRPRSALLPRAIQPSRQLSRSLEGTEDRSSLLESTNPAALFSRKNLYSLSTSCGYERGSQPLRRLQACLRVLSHYYARNVISSK